MKKIKEVNYEKNLKIITWVTALFLALSVMELQRDVSVVNAMSDSPTSPVSSPSTSTDTIPPLTVPTIAPSPIPAPAVPEIIPVHTHNFQYVLMQDASETQDAVLLLQCSCGATDGRIIVPGSAIGLFIKDVIEKITNAPKDAVVTIDTEIWTCYNQAVIDALAKRPDVTLVTNYRYNHVDYTVTIPAGYEVTNLIDENGYCGFRHLDQIFSGNEVTRN